eukprot:TRINITY_DN1341_c0_g1_i1.p1 TRINITY_DN1341_c0_g1~~TRINITY_DN1341_c0_g1_i1.p1  ORF type:complete len:74 (+),score=34.58 TRINITY_DN1341_c0_g1_i1:163-384(+)
MKQTFSYLKNARRTEEGITGYIQDLRKVRPLLKWTIHAYHMATENTSKRHKRRKKKKYRLRGRSSETAKAHRG